MTVNLCLYLVLRTVIKKGDIFSASFTIFSSMMATHCLHFCTNSIVHLTVEL